MEWVFDFVGILMALLPGAIIAQHALYLALYRKKFISMDRQSGIRPRLQHALQVARTREDREFSPRVLFVRYGTPAILIAVVGTVLFFLLGKLPEQLKPLDQPLWFGSVGAYVYILLLLTQRNFQRDITSGAAWWCAATLVVGPILAAVLAHAWTAGKPPNQDNAQWAKTSLYFLAGLAPRYVVGSVQEIFRRLWLSGAATTAPSVRSVPIGQVRGIVPQVEDRLAEEGILDVTSLAMADPHKLLRNTNYDPRTILNWIDEALLILTLPKNWQDLETEGITGAIDLASYADRTDPGGQAELQALAQKVHLEVTSLKSTVLRLIQDAQVQLIWVLYQSDADESTIG